MTDPNQLPTDLWDAEQLQKLEGYTTWFLKLNMPLIMLGVAVCVAGAIAGVILSIFYRNNNDSDDDDDEYEIRHY